MKRTILLVIAGTCLLSPFTFAQNSSNSSAATKQQKVVKVATITGSEAVREFQNNINVIQRELLAAKDLQAQVDKETDKKKKKELQAKLDAAMKKLDNDNAVMAKSYGYSLTRNYVIDVEQISIYTTVNDDEAAKVEQAAKSQAKK